MSAKPCDTLVNPLCHRCHQDGPGAQHRRNEQAFWDGLGIPPYVTAAFFWEHTGDYERCVAYIRNRGWA